MATDARKHTAPAAGETPRRQAFNDLSLSINDVVPVANDTERTQALLDLGSSATRVLIVRQQDTGMYWQHDGSAWRQLMLPALDATFALDTGLWTAVGETTLVRRGLFWQLATGFRQKTAGSISAGWTPVGTVPSEARGAAGEFYGAARVTSPDGASVSRITRGTGAVQILTPAFAGTTGTTFNVGLLWPAV